MYTSLKKFGFGNDNPMTFSQSSSGNPCDWSVYASHVVLPADERHHPVSFHICHINMLFMGFIGLHCRIRVSFTLHISSLSRFLRYVCIRGVFILTTECASLTVTLVVTLRKFLSLIISILYFHNPFTTWHWVGTAVVFLGTLLYTEVWSSIRVAMKGEKAHKKAE